MNFHSITFKINELLIEKNLKAETFIGVRMRTFVGKNKSIIMAHNIDSL
jgi:hypothetical protein